MNTPTIWIINHYALAPSQGGLCRHYYFAKTLIERGYSVRIFTSSVIHNSDVNMIDEKDKSLFKEIEVDGLIYTYIKSSTYKGNGFKRIKNMLSFAGNIKKIWKHYNGENPDVIYTSSPDLFTAWSAQKLARKHKIPVVTEIRDLWPLSIVEYKNFSNSNPAIKFLYRMEKKLYKRTDALVFTMPGGVDYIRDKGWDKAINLNKVFYINNGLDVEAQDRQREEFVLDDADLNSNTFKVVYAGSIRTANSVNILVKAAEILKSEQNIKFLIYGDGTDKASLEKYCFDNDLNNVFFKGKVDKNFIAYICSKASVNVLTYRNVGTWKYGGSQNKMFDYLNAGKPILTNIKIGYSLIEKYDCGIELNSDSAEDLAKAVLDLYSLDSERYIQMCENARNAAKDFDFSILTDKLEEAMKYAIEHNRS